MRDATFLLVLTTWIFGATGGPSARLRLARDGKGSGTPSRDGGGSAVLDLAQRRAAPTEPPVMRHDKVAGEGYRPGSPLYEEQLRDAETRDASEEPEQAELHGPVEPDAIMTPESSDPGTRVHDVPLSTMMYCILSLTCQYFVIHAVLVIVRVIRSFYEDGQSFDNSVVVQTILTTQATVNYMPMLCVVFLCIRMRAVQLTQGRTDEFGLPQWWVQVAMKVSTWSILAQLVAVLMFPCVFQQAVVTDNDGNCLPPKTENDNGCGMGLLLFVRYSLMALLYGAFVVLCVGIWVMEAPSDLFPNRTPPVSPAVTCVTMLATQYFVVYLILAVCRTLNQIKITKHTLFLNTFQLAAYTVNLAPMLSILFIAARVRALQMDPVNGNPQGWAQWCFYICTYCIIAQTFVVVSVPLIFGGQARKGRSEGDIAFKIASPIVSTAFAVIRVILLICIYGALIGVLVSVIVIQHPDGPYFTPPVSTAMQCVMFLTVQFFAIYMCLMVVNQARYFGPLPTSEDGMQDPQPLSCRDVLAAMLEAAWHSVMLSPMLSILFVAARMRSLLLTGNRGSPQGWAQDCMCVATGSVFLQLLLVIACACINGRNVSEDGGISPGKTSSSRALFVAAEGLRHLLLLLTYGGAVGVVAAILLMTPRTANGRGRKFPVFRTFLPF